HPYPEEGLSRQFRSSRRVAEAQGRETKEYWNLSVLASSRELFELAIQAFFRAVSFLLRFPSDRSAFPLGSILPYGARTFLPRRSPDQRRLRCSLPSGQCHIHLRLPAKEKSAETPPEDRWARDKGNRSLHRSSTKSRNNRPQLHCTCSRQSKERIDRSQGRRR